MAKLQSGTIIYGTATVNTQLFVSGTQTSTSTNTGALQVAGGVGVGGALYIGTNSYVNNSLIITSGTISTYAVTGISAGTDTAVSSTGSGQIIIWNTSTLQSITSRGNSTNQAITISNTSSATSTTTGALVVTGGVGIGGNAYVGGRVGFVNTSNVSVVYQYYNPATGSLDTVFG